MKETAHALAKEAWLLCLLKVIAVLIKISFFWTCRQMVRFLKQSCFTNYEGTKIYTSWCFSVVKEGFLSWISLCLIEGLMIETLRLSESSSFVLGFSFGG